MGGEEINENDLEARVRAQFKAIYQEGAFRNRDQADRGQGKLSSKIISFKLSIKNFDDTLFSCQMIIFSRSFIKQISFFAMGKTEKTI